jgi:peptidoglycan hydrolase-like protein with peptidoglycan-binding domain
VPVHAPSQFAPFKSSEPPSLVDAFSDPTFSPGAGPIPGVLPEQAPGAPVPSASEQAFDRPTLVQGSNGPSVMELQARLNQRGEALAVDGLFGPLTRAAVVRFQQANALAPDGIVGPLTWGALVDTPAPESEAGDGFTDLGGSGDNVAVGDAEGNRDDDGRKLETLDRDGDETESLPGLGSTGNLFGFGPTPPRTPVANANKAALLAGGFADLGAYRTTGDGFDNAELDGLLADYGAFWGVDVRAVPDPAAANAPAPVIGDSPGKGVSSHPPWIKALQNKIIGRKKWDADDRATQKLIEAFLRQFALDVSALPPGAEQLFHQIGASETNGEAGALGGSRGGNNWCAQASHAALLIGMYNRGIRFKTDKHLPDFHAEMRKQLTAYAAWTKIGGNVIGGKLAHVVQLEPGDIISVVNGGRKGPLSGHVATVVEHTGDDIVYVSGNAAGVVDLEGAVRIEQVKRKPPPDSYNWLAIAARENTFQGHKQAEKRSRAEVAKDGDILFNDQAIIESNLPHVQFPPVEFHVFGSVLAYTAVANAHADEAASPLQVKTAAADMIFRSTKMNNELGNADNSAAAKTTMLTDGPDELPVSRDPTVDRRFIPDTHAPADEGVSWVVEVIRASTLTTAQVLASGATKTIPNDPALESGPTLATQCPNAPPEVINLQASQ